MSANSTTAATRAGLEIEYNHDLDVAEPFLAAHSSIREALRDERLLDKFVYFDKVARAHKRSFQLLGLWSLLLGLLPLVVAALRMAVGESAFMCRSLVVSFLATVAQEARKDKQYGAAVTAMVQAAKVAGAYVERTEQAIDWTGNMEDLTEAQVERLMFLFERLAWGEDRARIEAERRKAGLIEGSVTPIEPHAESS